MHKGSEFYDTNRTFEDYTARRHNPNTPNETLEKPVMMELIGDVNGQEILDLGCGDGVYGLELLKAGCARYHGVDSSLNMVYFANQNLKPPTGEVVHSNIEDWEYPVEKFNLVISRLALHYVADLEGVFDKVYQTLQPGGRFIFSIVHPVITSCDRSRTQGGRREDWIVDDYFVPGSRRVFFMGEYVEQFHRTVEDIFKALKNSGFTIQELRESNPRPENFEDSKLYARRRRILLFLFFSSRK